MFLNAQRRRKVRPPLCFLVSYPTCILVGAHVINRWFGDPGLTTWDKDSMVKISHIDRRNIQ